MVIKGEEWDSIRLARAGCRRWQSALFALRLYKGERNLNAFGERRPRSVRANIETRRINASMIALPSFPPSSGLPRPQGRLFSLSVRPRLAIVWARLSPIYAYSALQFSNTLSSRADR
ncbi:hypothetical protein FA13DRAFT_1462082 [Coprinellus micaceus]|uniref:Uncharacterized protein n=1 Tax=Coprinellus micaceus TaxID=71717 RepID=A0A4Y7SM72_COPMI|nr:hypothetical protein FA13DRAFT_1462082 [Coprinellus micaceus]